MFQLIKISYGIVYVCIYSIFLSSYEITFAITGPQSTHNSSLKSSSLFSNLPTLYTQRLILRTLQITDVEDIFTLTSDPLVIRLTTLFQVARTKTDASRYIKGILTAYKKGTCAPWALVDKKTNKVIGIAGFNNYVAHHARGEISYAIIRSYWNQGFATEAAQALIHFGFNKLGLHRIQGICDPRNKASARVLEKCGMKFEGLLRHYLIIHGKNCNRKMYAIIKD
jgi:[ribosomal protein S5]-alanine N-acetyltransferase